MAKETVTRLCEHCGTTYTVFGGMASTHCVPCFACGQYQSFRAMYGRVRGRGYCCRACEARDHWPKHLVFESVLNLPETPSLGGGEPIPTRA